MGLKFRLKGLAETFIDSIKCPGCGTVGHDDAHFTTELTKVTFDGIVVVMECKTCGEIFVPATQRLGIFNVANLKQAVKQDCREAGLSECPTLTSVRLDVEKLNAAKRNEIH
jgi:hypothetical protein